MKKTSIYKTLGLLVVVFSSIVFLKFAPSIVASNSQSKMFSSKFQNFCLYARTINTPFLHCKNILNEFDAIYFLNFSRVEHSNSDTSNIKTQAKDAQSDDAPPNTKENIPKSSDCSYWLALALALPFIAVFLILFIPQKTHSLIDSQCSQTQERKPHKKRDNEML